MEDVAAADELVGGDGGVGEEDGDDAEDARGLVVAGFEEVWDGELGELAGAGGDEVDEQEAGPAAAALPERGEPVFVGVFGAAEEGAGTDPGAEQGEDEDKGGEGTAGNEVVGFGLDLGNAGERNAKKSEDDEGENDRVKIHGLRESVPVLGRWWTEEEDKVGFPGKRKRRRLQRKLQPPRVVLWGCG